MDNESLNNLLDRLNSNMVRISTIKRPDDQPLLSNLDSKDQELLESYLTPPDIRSTETMNINFEDSFEYIRMYFNSGRYQGFKFYDGDDLIILTLEKKKKAHFKVFKPLGNTAVHKLPILLNTLSTATQYGIHQVCLNNTDLQSLKDESNIKIRGIKEFSYYLYDLDTLNDLRGNQWKNVRQRITSFEGKQSKLKVEHLSTENCNDVVHFIGEWRRQLMKDRGYSYSNLEKNKAAAKYYSGKNDFKNVWAMVYRLQGRVVAFQMLYRLGESAAAHAIGLADTTINGLSEYTQIHIWKELRECGIRFINDGSSWRPGVEKYKKKFNPIKIQQVFECKIEFNE
jgi:hypothetical protein